MKKLVSGAVALAALSWTLSAQARHSLEEISKLVQDSADVSLEIANASREQTKATEHVARAMEMIESLTAESVVGATNTSRFVPSRRKASAANKIARSFSFG